MNTEDIDLASGILLLEKIEATLVTLNRLRALKRRLVLSWIIVAASTAIMIGASCGVVAYLVFALL